VSRGERCQEAADGVAQARNQYLRRLIGLRWQCRFAEHCSVTVNQSEGSGGSTDIYTDYAVVC
jgi:hypothetical protein